MEKIQLIIVAIAIYAALASPPHRRIVGGTTASPGQFPFIASLNDPEELCGASIITQNWLLTAAHCIEFARPTSVIVVGTTFQHSGGTRYNITQMIKHENFSWTPIKDDIALIQIDGEFEFDDLVQPVEFSDPEAGTTCVTAGWGTIDDGSYPEELRYVEMEVLSLDECKEIDPSVDDREVCAEGVEGKGACGGDSGGPLVCGGKLVGVVSYGLAECGEGADVYTRPSAYVDWIKEHIE
ncbi:hypothetical protein Zmor_018888 [Zophobas morio]|uniref:Peptidase S1 domain-containing protein n=1 Tax=Zophobas morio TaxID=2755281 RepID=A0AA38ID51_9CUCU|nr:hypothetical protein Zmor_018888 [Zophobas morio]